MTRYIDADEVLEKLKAQRSKYWYGYPTLVAAGLDMAIEALEDADELDPEDIHLAAANDWPTDGGAA